MKTHKLLLLLMGMSIIGCSKLEEDPKSIVDSEGLAQALGLELAEGYLAGAYSGMHHRNFMSREMTQVLMFRSDMMAIGRTGSQERIDHDNFTVSADNGLIVNKNSYWPKVYQIIRATNDAIGAANSFTDEDQDVVNGIIAESRFIRAFIYFHLVRQFGAIPYLDDKTNLSEVSSAERTPAETVYANIIEDLEYAKATLPNVQSSRAKPSKATASAYLALVHLTREDFQLAYDEASDLISKEGLYSLGLEPDFQDLFHPTNKDGSLEPLFHLDFTGVSDGDQGRDYQVAFTGIRSDDQYTNSSGSSMGGGWSVEVPALAVYTTWDANDYRRTVTFDATAIQDGNVVPYQNYTVGDGRAVNRPHVAKYTRMANTTASQGNGRASTSHYYMMRYAEVLLIGAEAANEIGQTADAETWANRVMARARNGGNSRVNSANALVAPSAVPADLTGLSKDAFRTRILEERRYEFAYEMKRWYDIVRRRLGSTAFGPNGLESEVSTESGVGPGAKQFDANRDYLLPIPADEILINPNLTQNPGY